MLRQAWVEFNDAHRDGHVVVGCVLRKCRSVMDKVRIESLRALLESLIEKLAPAGAYACGYRKSYPDGQSPSSQVSF
jgi:hypothetical protein